MPREFQGVVFESLGVGPPRGGEGDPRLADCPIDLAPGRSALRANCILRWGSLAQSRRKWIAVVSPELRKRPGAIVLLAEAVHQAHFPAGVDDGFWGRT